MSSKRSRRGAQQQPKARPTHNFRQVDSGIYQCKYCGMVLPMITKEDSRQLCSGKIRMDREAETHDR